MCQPPGELVPHKPSVPARMKGLKAPSAAFVRPHHSAHSPAVSPWISWPHPTEWHCPFDTFWIQGTVSLFVARYQRLTDHVCGVYPTSEFYSSGISDHQPMPRTWPTFWRTVSVLSTLTAW